MLGVGVLQHGSQHRCAFGRRSANAWRRDAQAGFGMDGKNS
jgi:hypothetical protein